MREPSGKTAGSAATIPRCGTVPDAVAPVAGVKAVACMRITRCLGLLVEALLVEALLTGPGVALCAGMQNDAPTNRIAITTMRMFMAPAGLIACEGPSCPLVSLQLSVVAREDRSPASTAPRKLLCPVAFPLCAGRSTNGARYAG